MSRNHHLVLILAVLSENLENPKPRLVSTEAIADRTEITVRQLQPLLRTMEGMGIIQSDPDLHYHLITAAGLRWLHEREPSRTVRVAVPTVEPLSVHRACPV